MTAHFSWSQRNTRGHRPRLQHVRSLTDFFMSMKGELNVKTRADTAPLIALVCLWTVVSACSGMKGASTSWELTVVSTEKRELKADIVNPADVSMGTVK